MYKIKQSIWSKALRREGYAMANAGHFFFTNPTLVLELLNRLCRMDPLATNSATKECSWLSIPIYNILRTWKDLLSISFSPYNARYTDRPSPTYDKIWYEYVELYLQYHFILYRIHSRDNKFGYQGFGGTCYVQFIPWRCRQDIPPVDWYRFTKPHITSQ